MSNEESTGRQFRRVYLKLKRELGLLDIFCLASGAMISSGLFVLPGIIFAKVGPAMIISYALAGLLMIPSLFAQAELATAMPRAGGTYFYIERSLGALPGTFAGLANWFSIALKSAFALVGIGAFVSLVNPGFGELEMKLVAIVSCLLFSTANLVSVRMTGRAQVWMVLGLLALLAYFLFRGLTEMHHTHFANFSPYGLGSIFSGAGMVFVSFGGLTKIASTAEETRKPGRNVPLGMFLALGIVSVIYVFVVFVVVGVTKADQLRGSLTPISLAASQFMGPYGAVVMAGAAMLAFVTTANAGILSASRSPMAMGRDGLLPEWFQRVNQRFHTPHNSILITSLFIIATIAFLSVEDLVKTASAMMLILFVLMNISVIIMRKSNIPNYRPTVRSPLFPWLQVAAVLAYGFLIFEMGKIPLAITAIFAVGTSIWYLVYISHRIERESAFVYMVKSLAPRDIQRTGLEEELKQIALERDEVVHDRFDKLIQHCYILDIDKQIKAKEMFQLAAKELSTKLELPEDELYEKFIDREKESSTIIKPGLAIPHVVIRGSGKFELMLIRSRKGIVFSELNPPVTTVFLLAGSQDERNFHLRALMAIAHICQEEGFEERWLSAPGTEQLRDIVLLSSRKREKPESHHAETSEESKDTDN
jgi:amino acid transporter/mannitol/fructose-specific phosphotransferase system IIA component (Ntr-type)